MQRPVGLSTVGAPSVIDNVGQAAVGGIVTVPAGYTGPWDWSTSLPRPVGPMGAYVWPSGFPPPVGSQGTAGWVPGFSEQARGTTVAAPAANTVTTACMSIMSIMNYVTYVAGASGLPVPPPEVITAAAGNFVSPSAGPVGVGGWPVGVPPSIDPPGNTGWAMGFSEQARGTAQAAVTGVAGPRVVPQPPESSIG